MGYTKGIHDLGDGCYAYLQPDGGWGWSNAGLLVGDGQSLLVDTLFDLRLTGEMLDAMAPFTTAAPIATLVNTHSNGDHTYGNQLVAGAEIIASAACVAEMREQGQPLAQGSIRRDWRKMGEAGAYLATREHRVRIGGHAVQVIDATGAGDAFCGSFLARILAGDAPEPAARYANVAAALKCTGYGAVAPIPRPPDVYSAIQGAAFHV